MKFPKGLGAVFVIMLLLILDQALKIWVKTHMQLHESYQITSWFYIRFVENPGMAFGIEVFAKLFLSIFRIIAVGAIGYYLYTIIRKGYSFGFILCISLIFTGAIGNIIDSVFYGVIFDHSSGHVATFMPENGGYSTWLYGKVVDMFYFPLVETVLPEWVPIWGGEEFVFFGPIFNIADSAICVGVFALFIFYRRTLSKSLTKEEKHKEEEHAEKTV
ncbi:MAG: lipoprotein signal peptidase [Tannerellaceae bacterium]|jgi:signal peptidase II|nr:lipoprotein signal peptidase [Tannerellaceae bacterium]